MLWGHLTRGDAFEARGRYRSVILKRTKRLTTFGQPPTRWDRAKPDIRLYRSGKRSITSVMSTCCLQLSTTDGSGRPHCTVRTRQSRRSGLPSIPRPRTATGDISLIGGSARSLSKPLSACCADGAACRARGPPARRSRSGCQGCRACATTRRHPDSA